jgi:DNA-binding protein WhiA
VSATSTLSGDAKDALAREVVTQPHCRAALLDGLLRFGSAEGSSIFRTQRSALARLAWSLMDDRKEREIRKIPGKRLVRFATYEIDATTRAASHTLAKHRCDRRMELRGAFLACGSLASPARGYHVEFVPPSDERTGRLVALLRAEGLDPKIAPRKGKRIVYFKDVDAITRVLAVIGASHAVLQLEDIRALKETKNRIHRLVNTEAANVDRAMSAAAVQREAIAYVVEAYGLRRLSKPLREAAELRLAHPTETLAELGRRCTPPAKKSTINGRIAALLRIARELNSVG